MKLLEDLKKIEKCNFLNLKLIIDKHCRLCRKDSIFLQYILKNDINIVAVLDDKII